MYTKESETIQWPKPWQLIMAVSLRTKKFLNDFSGMAWPKTLRNTLKFVKVAKNKGRSHKINPEPKSIPVPNEVMKQIGIDLCTLPEVDGFKHLIVCIDYFSKWSEAKAVKDKSAPTVAKFLYEIICRHGCMRIQINDQGKEFVNEVSKTKSLKNGPISLMAYFSPIEWAYTIQQNIHRSSWCITVIPFYPQI